MRATLPLHACILATSLATACVEESDAELPEEQSQSLAPSDACGPLTEVIPPSELDFTERSAFTPSGRLFVIGSRPAPSANAGSWVVEIVRDEGGYRAENRVFGALQGTVDARIGGERRGDACTFSGMTVDGDKLYAGCFASDGRSSLLQIDVEQRTVRAALFTTCNREPASEPCTALPIYANGMTVDDEGRVYGSDMNAYGLAGTGGSAHSIIQMEIAAEQAAPAELRFVHRGWLATNLLVDGPAPNGIQYTEGAILFAGGANIQRIPVRDDGRAGPARVFYRGALLSMIDDFAVGEGELLVGRVTPSAIVALRTVRNGRSAREYASCPLPALAPASSLLYQPELEDPLFPPGSVIVTRYFGGGLWTLRGPRGPQ